jgi:transcriptional regulator GlxA family with amidase domain
MEATVPVFDQPRTRSLPTRVRPFATPPVERRSVTVSLAVHRAEALIRATPSAPHSADSLARSVGVSSRSLYRGFERLRRYGPMEAVRRARLMCVRRDLLTGIPGTRVTDAAMRWGFFHLGRFSSLYLDYFGELPSDTLRRSRSGAGAK